MKQLISISLSVLFLFTAAGYYFAFTIAQEHAGNEMTQTIQSSYHKHNAIQFSFSKVELGKEVRFTKADQREFIYRGQHYDVIKRQENGDQISFTCMADKKETSLFTEFDKHLTEQSSGNNTSGKTYAKPLVQDWFFQIQTSEIPLETSALLSSSELFFLPDVLFKIPSPPPKG